MPVLNRIILLAVFALAPAWATARTTEVPVSVANTRYEVRQTGEGEPWYDPLKGGRIKYRFIVEDRVSGDEKTLVIDTVDSELRRLDLTNGKLLVFGQEATSNAAVVTIVGLRDGAVVDSLMGFWPKLSPSKRYLVFKKFYSPKTADPPKRSDLVLLYDLERSADENRVRGLDAYRNDPIGLLTEVGLPVYPDLNARKRRYRVWVRDENKRHAVLSGGFFWPDGERRIAFVDRTGRTYRFVVIDITLTDGEPVIHSGVFNPLENDADDMPRASTGPFTLGEVSLLGSGDLRIDLSDRDGEEQSWQFTPKSFIPPLFTLPP